MGTTKKPDQKEQKKELKAEKKSKILDAIKKIDNEKGKLHDTIKIDEEILMVNYESIEPKFKKAKPKPQIWTDKEVTDSDDGDD